MTVLKQDSQGEPFLKFSSFVNAMLICFEGRRAGLNVNNSHI